jgi:drug/metabolite transporter (DMT)-like permease
VKVWLALLGTVLAWAATFHAASYVVRLMPPIAAASWRFILAAVFLVSVVSLRERWNWPALRANAWLLLFLGGIGIGGFQVGMFFGLQTSSATNAALITALSPALTVMLAAWLEHQAVPALRWLGLLLGLAGVVVVATGGSWAALRALRFGRGDLWLMMGATTWAVYSVVLRRYVRDLSVLQLSASTIVICALTLTLLNALLARGHSPWPPSATWLPLLFIGLVGSGFAYLWWNQAVIRLGAARATVFMNLTPLLTMLMGVAIGEALSVAQLLGGALIIAGVLMATRQSRR